MWYHVVNRYRGNLSLQATYKGRDAAEKRADRIRGGETCVFMSMERDPEKALQEFRDEEVKR